MWNLRNKTEDHRGKKGKRKKGEREISHNRFLTIENKLRVAVGRW